ncbi:hypothetical protein [Facklamia miroungae]
MLLPSDGNVEIVGNSVYDAEKLENQSIVF